MQAEINQAGKLIILRPRPKGPSSWFYKSTIQGCIHKFKFCGDQCPHFRTVVVKSELKPKIILCHGTVLELDKFKDHRYNKIEWPEK
ncbi:MAG: hypothetical protein GTN53_22985 [Candidatus Aminicenantes bacterium]|nr:hypothetical protein [Candidatus Aminicenantes bacterium]NIQ69369.1 hypothetical protein [Candidatus Aminicenantes bacterium]NIT25370.1 hypothetical protein [Candidatus Aminicenantes bacterium]